MSWPPTGTGRRDGAEQKEQHEGEQQAAAAHKGARMQRPGLDAALYQTDTFRMYIYKITLCRNRDRHDWHACPFAHPSERARRRPPQTYSSQMCAAARCGAPCLKGDACEFAHHPFEAWLHPEKYRTKVCADGTDCKRKVCFFAHSDVRRGRCCRGRGPLPFAQPSVWDPCLNLSLSTPASIRGRAGLGARRRTPPQRLHCQQALAH